MEKLEKFLEFNGKRISILLADGTWWIAVKPICEALNVPYKWHHESISNDDIFGELSRNHGMVAADGKLREMFCLPEKYIYGWLLSVRSDSADLKVYKLKCYDILYDHFHGAMTGRVTTLNEKSETQLRMLELQEKLDAKMLETDEYKEMQELKNKSKQINKKLKDLDIELVQGQLSLNLT